MSQEERKMNTHPGSPPKQPKKATNEIVIKLNLDTKEFNRKLDEIYKKIVNIGNEISLAELNIDKIAEELAQKLKIGIIK
ncbi:hypothetical protein [Clostridium novyi]|uniref:hypothetical protein n=1 Tax=Clostridium novyi TaxID=1542 RepID=UPI0004D973FD|nr:hypothetical protein [Clostridium novyi]KEH88870.1 hypothetical protein Z964_p0034 [Clostridium novyi A str. GD211209]